MSNRRVVFALVGVVKTLLILAGIVVALAAVIGPALALLAYKHEGWGFAYMCSLVLACLFMIHYERARERGL